MIAVSHFSSAQELSNFLLPSSDLANVNDEDMATLYDHIHDFEETISSNKTLSPLQIQLELLDVHLAKSLLCFWIGQLSLSYTIIHHTYLLASQNLLISPEQQIRIENIFCFISAFYIEYEAESYEHPHLLATIQQIHSQRNTESSSEISFFLYYFSMLLLWNYLNYKPLAIGIKTLLYSRFSNHMTSFYLQQYTPSKWNSLYFKMFWFD